jgi:hypothetical protein
VHPTTFAKLRDLNTLTDIASPNTTTGKATIACLASITSLATYDALISHTCDYTYALTCVASAAYGSAWATCGTACTTYRSACAAYGSACAFTASHATTMHPISARMATLKKMLNTIS